MRNQGKITHWNEQKAYGFITPSSGAKQVFVHIRFGLRKGQTRCAGVPLAHKGKHLVVGRARLLPSRCCGTSRGKTLFSLCFGRRLF